MLFLVSDSCKFKFTRKGECACVTSAYYKSSSCSIISIFPYANVAA